MKKIIIKWDIKAKDSLKLIYQYLKKKSLQGAISVKNDLLAETKKLHLFPNKYQIEPNLGAPYPYCVVRHYKIIYRLNEEELRVVDIFDTQQDPKKIQVD